MQRESAPAKLTVTLRVTGVRDDGYHLIDAEMVVLDLADELEFSEGDGLEVTGPSAAGVTTGPENLVRRALALVGRTAHVRLDKRVPSGAGLGGGSADAAAVLRLACEASGMGDRRLLEDIASTLGSDVASQVRGGLVLATGEGSRLRPLNVGLPYSVVVLPIDARLPTVDVYAEADRLCLGRETLDLARSLTRMQAALSAETILEHLHNDLQDAARSLCPQIDEALEAALAAGADHALVSGSGPTVIAVFAGSGHAERAARVCESIAAEGRTPAPVLARPAAPYMVD